MTASTQNLRLDLDQSTGVLTMTFTPRERPVVAVADAADTPDATDVAGVTDAGETVADPAAEVVSANIPPTIESCREALAEHGYDTFQIDETALAGFVRASMHAKEAVTMTVAHRRDGEFALDISFDLMQATLTLIPPRGGKSAVPDAVDAMRERNVVYGIRQAELDAALTAGICEKLVIAQGVPPIEGTPCQFVSLLKDPAAGDGNADDDEENGDDEQEELDDRFAIIKYRDLGFLLLVAPGDHLMRRTPPVSGTNGVDVRGNPVLAKPMHEIRFNEKSLGVTPDPDDPNLLVAAIAGQPLVITNGVIVNPIVEVDNIDFTTGNIDFNGTITVKGDVKAGMVLKVSGDVVVKGLVEAAEIHAGGNVSVSGGIIGHVANQASTLSTASAVPFANARIVCGGSLQALFAEQAYVQAGESILIKANARQCELIAGKQIVVGNKGGGKKSGQIVGGKTHATNLIQAVFAGSATGVTTELQVGTDPFLATQIATNEVAYKRKLEEVDRVIKLQAFLKQNPKKAENGVGDNVNETRRRLLAESKALFEEHTALKEKLVSVEEARVKISQGLFEGVEVRIGPHLWQVTSDLGGGTIQLKNDSISLS